MITIAYQGKLFSNSYYAAIDFAKKLNDKNKDGEVILIPCLTSEGVLTSLRNGLVEYGVVALMNNRGGAFKETQGELSKYDFEVLDRCKRPIEHHLFGIKGARIKDIKEIYSHPQALKQCDIFINDKKINANPSRDTADSTRLVSDKGSKEIACLCSEEAGLKAGLKRLKKNVEKYKNKESNDTTFILIENVNVKDSSSYITGVWKYKTKEGDTSSVIPFHFTRFLKITLNKETNKFEVEGYIEGQNSPFFTSTLENLRYEYSFAHGSGRREGVAFIDFKEGDLSCEGVYYIPGIEVAGKIYLQRVHENVFKQYTTQKWDKACGE